MGSFEIKALLKVTGGTVTGECFRLLEYDTIYVEHKLIVNGE